MSTSLSLSRSSPCPCSLHCIHAFFPMSSFLDTSPSSLASRKKYNSLRRPLQVTRFRSALTRPGRNSSVTLYPRHKPSTSNRGKSMSGRESVVNGKPISQARVTVNKQTTSSVCLQTDTKTKGTADKQASSREIQLHQAEDFNTNRKIKRLRKKTDYQAASTHRHPSAVSKQ